LQRTLTGHERVIDLPRSVVIGPPGAGKTTAFRYAMTHPLPDGDVIHGPGDAAWWLTTQGILIDVEMDEARIRPCLQVLAGHAKPSSVLANITLVVPVDSVQISASEEETDRLGKRLRVLIEEVASIIGECPPIDVLVTKLDLVPGFTSMWSALRRSDRIRVLGRLVPRDDRPARQRFRDSFDDLARGLCDWALKTMAHSRSFDAWRALEFVLAFDALRTGLEGLVEGCFPSSPRLRALPLRGVYFTSSSQAPSEERTLRTRVEQVLDVSPVPFNRAHEQSYAYFIADLMRLCILR
jgi:type VI secretion system protein ImpL